MIYYEPNKAEFCAGMDYEVFIPERNCWSLEVFYLNESHLDLIKNNKVRIKYLDKEDVEGFGFELKRSEKDVFLFYKIIQYRGEDNLCSVALNEISHWICIEITINKEAKTIFAGRIKNKSEFYRLIDQLMINPYNQLK